jgi:hypothetical protein
MLGYYANNTMSVNRSFQPGRLIDRLEVVLSSADSRHN